MCVAISLNNVGKRYTIQHSESALEPKDSNSLRNCLGLFGDSRKKAEEDFWALKGVSFDVEVGERIGIVGRNGAGKSTLLKVLTRITEPTEGAIGINGRVASLLEVGTGFHPELTGRENIFLNGSILGMSQRDIKSRLDEIVSFSEVERFLDTPVKRYSSGMYTRLAFSVAAHLEPDILIVDEVLAVGDAQFQSKCLGKMEQVSGEGRTLIFVSHNNAAIAKLCTKAALMKNGQLEYFGGTFDALKTYSQSLVNNFSDGVDREKLKECKAEGFEITAVRALNGSSRERSIRSADNLLIELDYRYSGTNPSPAIVISLKSSMGFEIARFSNLPMSGRAFKFSDQGMIGLSIDSLPLVGGRYFIDVAYAHERVKTYFKVESLMRIDVEGVDVYGSGVELDQSKGVVWMKHDWSLQ
jgi:lipopolysaccharide transport system ATP-binding protein